ncbi:MAG: helix-turn-helix domain-containing protein, partial [Chloroflexi bacterium]|nr:helix-turn-helix domain-containing protein [Chloroflexota bacterium]
MGCARRDRHGGQRRDRPPRRQAPRGRRGCARRRAPRVRLLACRCRGGIPGPGCRGAVDRGARRRGSEGRDRHRGAGARPVRHHAPARDSRGGRRHRRRVLPAGLPRGRCRPRGIRSGHAARGGCGMGVDPQERGPVTEGATDAAPIVLNEAIHQPTRLRIMTMLVSVPETDRLAYGFIQQTLGLTGGNLTTHLRRLQDAGYLDTTKEFIDAKPR